MLDLIRRLGRDHRLSTTEYASLLRSRTPETVRELRRLADQARRACYGTTVQITGVLEISSICKNDCLYCNQRRSNRDCPRFRLRTREILECCEEADALELRSILLRGGEDAFYSDAMLEKLIGKLKYQFPGCQVNLALGERSRESYERLYNAGADGYLLRHEAADRALYERMHPNAMSYDQRMHCLNDLMDIGYQVGCGFIVGLPGQGPEELARDLKYIEEFRPHMVDIGPFRPMPGTPLAGEPAGSAELTACLLSIIRLILPNALLTAPLEGGSDILAGANLVRCPISSGPMNDETLAALRQAIADVGFEASTEKNLWQEELQ